MSKPYIHAKSSAKRYGGVPNDYMDIHNMMDSSKSTLPTNLHRVIFHHAFGCFVMEKIFGITRTNSAGKEYSVRDIAEQHILEDFGHRFIPTVQDYLEKTPVEDWMNNQSGFPPSFQATIDQKKQKAVKVEDMVLDGSMSSVPVIGVDIPLLPRQGVNRFTTDEEIKQEIAEHNSWLEDWNKSCAIDGSSIVMQKHDRIAELEQELQARSATPVVDDKMFEINNVRIFGSD